MRSEWLTADQPLNIGHRGASAAAPANTLVAFRKAAEMGAHGIELDAHLSADGVPVVIHDFTVDGTTDGTGYVADLPLAALKELDAGTWFDPAFAGARIPTLDEVFADLGQQVLLNVELKVKSGEGRELAATVVALVEQHGLAGRVLISSFNPHTLRHTRRLAPHLPTGFLYGPLPESWRARWQVRRMSDLQTETINPYWRLIRPPLVRRAHARGQRVAAWTVNEVATMQRLVDWGVDAIITNHPDKLRSVLNY
jgi:glycerophosphoryl diester phosphodiesterase